jgi:hypothetical protein
VARVGRSEPLQPKISRFPKATVATTPYSSVRDESAVIGTSNVGTFSPTNAIVAGHGYTILISTITAGVSTITANNGDTIVKAKAQENTTSVVSSEVWYCAASLGGIPTITITNSAADGNLRYQFNEWNQALGAVRATNGLTANDTGTSTLIPNSGSVAVLAGDLVVATMRATGDTWSAWPTAGGWVGTAMDASTLSHGEWLAAKANGQVAASAQFAAGDNWTAVIVAFAAPTGFIAGAHQVPTGATMNLALPAGAVLNGWCLIIAVNSSSTAIADAIAGSTVLLSAPANNMYARVLAKQLNATDISNGFLAVTSTTTSHDFWILAYDTTVTGFDSVNSFPLSSTFYGTRGGVSQTPVTAPTVTPNSSSDYVILISSERTTAAATVVSSIGQGSPDYYSEDTTNTNCSLLAAHFIGPTAGSAISADTITYSGASGNAIAFLLPMTAVSSGPAPLIGTPADPEGITDTATPVQDLVRAQADAEGILDAAAPVQDLARLPVEPVGLLDTASVQQDIARTVADLVGLLDTASIKQDVVRAQVDAIGLLDTTTATQGLVRSPADPTGIVDAATAVQGLSRTQVDSEGIIDSATASLSMPRQIDDPVGLTDTASAAIGLQRVPADPIGITDSVSATLTTAGVVTVADQVGLTDAASAKIDSVRSAADQVGLVDTATAGLGFIRTAVDPVGLSDTAAAIQQAIRTATDPVGITDAVVLARALPMDDPTALTDSVTASLGMNRETDDGLGLIDSVAAFLDRVRTQDDPVGISDSVIAVLTPAETDYTVDIEESLGISDLVTAVLVRGGAPGWHDTVNAPLIPPEGASTLGAPWHDVVSGGLIPHRGPAAQPNTPPWRDVTNSDNLIPPEEFE